MDLQAILDSTDESSSGSSDYYNNGGHVNAVFQRSAISSRTPSKLSTGNGVGSSLSPPGNGSNHQKGPVESRHRPYGSGLVGDSGGGTGEVDLEQILREDDDDDDVDDDDDDSVSGMDPMDDHNVHSRGGSSSGYHHYGNHRYHEPTSSSSSLSRMVSPTNPEEWDVLQAILGEDDDGENDDVADEGDEDDDDDEHVLVKAAGIGSYSKYYHEGSRNANETSRSGASYASDHRRRRHDVVGVRNKTVDLILQQSDDEEDPSGFSVSQQQLLQVNVEKSNHFSSKDSSQDLSDLMAAPADSFVTAQQSQESSDQTIPEMMQSPTDEAISPPRKEKSPAAAFASFPQSIPSAIPSTIPSQNNTARAIVTNPMRYSNMNNDISNTKASSNPLMATSDAELEKASEMALQVAQAQERKLLKSGHRDIVSPLMVKRRLKPKIELGTRMQKQREQEGSHNNTKHTKKSHGIPSTMVAPTATSSTMPRFNFSGNVMDTKNMKGVSKTLYDRCRSHQDLPTALGINSRFIAVGTQKGIILVFDLFEVLRQRLGGSSQPVGEGNAHFNYKTAGAVTTIDLSLTQGEFLAAGYTSGNIVLWDSIKGVALKSVIETNIPSPVVSVRFLSDLKVVTVDASGLVNKLSFSKNMLWTTYSVESECLLDGTAGQILAMNVLPPFQTVKQQLPKDATTFTMKKLVLIALSSERSSFAVAVEPKVHVLHRWAKPPPERVGELQGHNATEESCQLYLPCLSWGWALVNGGGHVINPILARAWGCCIQLLRANFPDPEVVSEMQEVFQWPAFGVHDEFDVDVPVVALEWLNERSLVYLSMNNEFTVVDTVMMTLLERLDFSGLKLVYAEFSLSRRVAAKNIRDGSAEASDEDDEIYFCTTFQNSFRSCDSRLLLLCQEELKSVSIVGARPRISGLESDGEWLEALALALDHYENTIKSQEDRKRDPSGRRDLSKHPGLVNEKGRSEEEEWIAKLLIRYLNIAVENAPETSSFDIPLEIRQSQLDLARSHFQMLAGVCVEFCVVTKRLDLLFGPIFRRFHSSGFLNVFLDVLEPYILNDKLDYIAPEAMMHFVEHCRANNGIATVERCLLHMDVTIMDFDSILNLLRVNEMYSALFYVYNQGLKDYTTPLEILCERIFDASDTAGTFVNERRIDGVPQGNFERYGYKAILYLQSCFRGRTFPQDVELPEGDIHSVRRQLLTFLLQDRYKPSSSIKTPAQVVGKRDLRYPYTHILLMVDSKAMFNTLSIAMNAPDEEFVSHQSIESVGGWEVEIGAEARGTGSSIETKRSPGRQEIISMLLCIMMPSEDDVTITHQTTLYQSKSAVNAFLDFLAEYLMKGVIRADKAVTFKILKRMATRYASAKEFQERQHWQGQVISLLSALPRTSYDTDSVLHLVQKAGIHRASLLLHQEEASIWPHDEKAIESRAMHFRAAIACYLDDDDPDFKKEVFAYAKKECSGASDDDDPKSLRGALVSKLTDLVLLDPLMTAELTAELFVEEIDRVIHSLGEEQKFKFLRAIISGDLNEIDSVAGSVLNAQLTMEHHQQYMALMAQLHPELVYDYLSSHDNYRAEECLQLCQKYDIADASAYLLERMGNVTSALQLILQTMESRMMNLKRTIRGMGTEFFDKRYPRMSKHDGLPKRDTVNSEMYGKQEKEIDGVKRILIVALDVCQRNSGNFCSRADTEHGSQLWFNVLDRLINAKGFLRLSKEQPAHAKIMAGVLSELLRLTMQRMVSSVPLPDLVRKVTSDHSGSRLGELREMIESLLITYGLELDVFGGAVNVFHHDSQQMGKSHHALRIKGSTVKSILTVPLDGSSLRTLQGIRNKHAVLQLGGESSRNASVAASPSQTRSGVTNERGLGEALSRLRSRRGAKGSRPVRTTSSMGLSLMTQDETAYCESKTSSDVTFFEDRQIGQLSEAEHRGRIMSFMY